jgi:carbamoyl-phosphate synthase large subunit
MLGQSLADQGIKEMLPPDSKRFYVKAPAFSFSKLTGMDAYLSPEMKSTGEAIGYDKKLHWAMYKALEASGVTLHNHGSVLVTVADEDKAETLPLVRRFCDMGFNIEATTMTADFLSQNGIKVRKLPNLSEGSEASLDAIRSGRVSYVINTRAILSGVHYANGAAVRRCAVENGITVFTSLDTVRMVLDVLEEMTIPVSVINEQ